MTDSFSMVVTGAAQICVVDQRRRRIFLGGCGFAREESGDVFATERANLERTGRDGFGETGINAAIKLQDPEAGSKALLGMAAAGEHGRDQSLRVLTDLGRPAAEAIRCPGGVTPV